MANAVIVMTLRMKQIIFALVIMVLAVVPLTAQINPRVKSAPLLLFTSGGGKISPLQGGQQLNVGEPYSMTAIPDAGYKFGNWQRVQVTIDVDNVAYPSGAFITHSNATIKPLESVKTASIGFLMAPVTVATTNYGFSTHTEGTGWQANFTPTDAKK